MTDVSKETLIAAVSRRDPAGAHCKNRLFEVGDWHDARHRAVHPVHAEDDIRRRVPLLLEANWNAQVIATIFVGFGIVRASATRTGH